MNTELATRQSFLRRVVLAGMASERIESAAVTAYPNNIYAQTCIVTGLDPLGEMSPDERTDPADE
jgi:hypothetical protein